MGSIPTAFTHGGLILERVSLSRFLAITRAFEQGPHENHILEIVKFAEREWKCDNPDGLGPANMRLRIILALAQKQPKGQHVPLEDVRRFVVASETHGDEEGLMGLIEETFYDVNFQESLDRMWPYGRKGEGFCQ